MRYHTVFNSTRTSLGWWLWESPSVLLLSLVVVLLVGCLLLVVLGRSRAKWVLIVFLVVLGGGGLLGLSFRYHLSRHVYSYYGRNTTTLEGVVENYRELRTSKVVGEQFDVNAVHFSYMDTYQWKCFHRAAANGGPIHEGARVRVSYVVLHVAPCIVKLEVADSAP
jgi:hypothetical protein